MACAVDRGLRLRPLLSSYPKVPPGACAARRLGDSIRTRLLVRQCFQVLTRSPRRRRVVRLLRATFDRQHHAIPARRAMAGVGPVDRLAFVGRYDVRQAAVVFRYMVAARWRSPFSARRQMIGEKVTVHAAKTMLCDRSETACNDFVDRAVK